MAAKAEITHRCEAPWRHTGTRKVESHTYPWKVNGEYRRLCWPCWQKVDAERGIKRGVTEADRPGLYLCCMRTAERYYDSNARFGIVIGLVITCENQKCKQPIEYIGGGWKHADAK